jgi:hypothetical protein
MMQVLLPIAIAVACVWFLYIFYAAVMNFQQARDSNRMGPMMRYTALPALFVGLLLDAFVNITVCTLLFLELPQEWLVTSRLSRHQKRTGWRAKIASWLCKHLLDPLDPSGCHCK